jgi:hypothetical protein
MNLQTAAQINASQDEVLISTQPNGAVAVYLGTNMQNALGLKDTIFVGVKNRKVSFAKTETNETPYELRLHLPSPTSKRLRAYTKKNTPILPNVVRTVNSITFDNGIASFKY